MTNAAILRLTCWQHRRRPRSIEISACGASSLPLRYASAIVFGIDTSNNLVKRNIMVIGYGVISLRISESSSLKEKRSVLSKILKRTQNEFNVSIAEIDDLDYHKLAKIGFAIVGNDSRFVNGKIDHLLRFIDNLHAAEMLNSKIEIMVVSDFLETTAWNIGKYDEL
jgi:uncharacterized protein YlxP (DUF503 family)